MKLRGIRRVFRFPSRSSDDVREDIRQEFQFHLDMRTEDLVREGLDRATARAQARREFGNWAEGARECAKRGDRIERRRLLERLASEFVDDVAFGMRLIRRNPGFATTVVLTLAVAIGANTTIFSVLNALLLKPLPVRAPEALGRVKAGETQMAWANYDDIRRTNDVFAELAAQRTTSLGLITTDRPARLRGQETSDNFFVALAVDPAIGRAYTPADSRRDVVVLADHIWRARFAADPSTLGRVVVLGGRPYEVIGIMPRGFRGAAPPGWTLDFWIPFNPSASSVAADRTESEFEVIGRLKPGVARAQAASSLRVLARQLRAEHPEVPAAFVQVDVIPVDGLRAFEGMARLLLPIFAFLGVMAIVSGFVLLIGCANIAGMLIGRASARRHEIAIRIALGAGRGRLLRQLLSESLVLAIAGGAAGLVLAGWLTRTLVLAASAFFASGDFDFRTDVRVLGYSLAVTLFATLAFGLVPARRASRFDVATSLKDDHGGSTGRQRLRRMLVVGQVAVSTALLLWCGLFVRSLGRIHGVDPGFDPNGVVLANFVFDRQPASVEREVLRQLEQRVRASVGVHAAGLASIVPLAMRGREEFSVTIENRGGTAEPRRVVANRLGPGWFETVRIPPLEGRDFTPRDQADSPPVVIVNQTLARQFWNGAALGRRVMYGRQPLEVIGVVRDSKYRTLGETIAPTVYLPLAQSLTRDVTLHVRTTDAKSTTVIILAEMQRLVPEVAVEVEPMTDAVGVAVLPARIGAAATAAFGVLAILLSALGVYGLVSFAVVQRTREIGIRRALGARTLDIVGLVVGGVAALTAAGLAGGLGMGALGGFALSGFIYGVSPLDPLTLAAAAAIVAGTALAASGLPAWIASRVNPVLVLRDL